WRSGAGRGPWFASSMSAASTGSSTRSFTGLTWNGKHAPSSSLHKQLDITHYFRRLTIPPVAVYTKHSRFFGKAPRPTEHRSMDFVKEASRAGFRNGLHLDFYSDADRIVSTRFWGDDDDRNSRPCNKYYIRRGSRSNGQRDVFGQREKRYESGCE